MGDAEQGPQGHRARLRQRLLAGGSDALADYELLEFLLMLAIPRQDTKPWAKTLIARFGGLAAVLTAEPDALARTRGMGEAGIAAVKIAQASALRLLRAEASRQPVLSGWQALLDYLQADMAHGPVERFRVLHLNARNMLIHDDLMAEGSIDEAPVYVRKVIARAMELHSVALILVHNHPSGDPQPSRADIEITRKLADAARLLDIAIHDHLVIGTSGHSSMRALGLI
jgi:DNA repair protein RadC